MCEKLVHLEYETVQFESFDRNTRSQFQVETSLDLYMCLNTLSLANMVVVIDIAK